MAIRVERYVEGFPEDAECVNNLFRELAFDPEAPIRSVSYTEIIEVAESNIFIVARDLRDNKIVGMGTLIRVTKLGCDFGLIEDVVVTKEYRRLGYGGKIVRMLIEEAKKIGLDYIDLTSNPRREVANGIYQRLGFEPRATNMYRLKL